MSFSLADQKKIQAAPPKQGRAEDGAKGAQTRARILEAALEVFSTTPFRTASLRSIAARAGVKHPLVIHYFGSKAGIFEEVAASLERDILESRPGFFQRLKTLPASERGRVFLRGVIHQGLRQPGPYKFLLFQAGAGFSKGPIPGMERMIRVHERILTLAREHVLRDVSDPEASWLMLVFTLVTAQFTGARAFHSNVLGLSGDLYEKWACDSVELVFSPFMSDDSVWRPRGPVQPPPSFEPAKDGGARPRTKREKAPATRGGKARRRILKAAKKVFSSHGYDSATIRMVGSAGGFDFSRIHHLFPCKEDLFAAVAKEAYGDFMEALEGWRNVPPGLHPKDIFRRFLEQGLRYCFDNRETLGLVARNIAHYESYEHLAGFVHMTKVHANMVDMARKSMPPGSQADMLILSQWMYAVAAAGYALAAAPNYPARVLNLGPDSEAYRRRVFEILYFVFAPSMMRSATRLGAHGEKN